MMHQGYRTCVNLKNVALFCFQVERGMSWEAAEQKKEEGAQDENEGYWLSMQVL